MRSRELPAIRTLVHAWPDAARSEGGDHLVLELPTGPVWVLDEPPDDLSAWLDRAAGAELWWEDRLSTTRGAPAAPLPGAEGHAPIELRCFLHDDPLEPGRPEGIRDLGDEVDAAVALLAELSSERLARWQLEAQLRARDEGAAAVLAVGPEGAPTGVVSVTWNGREARVTGLVVAPGHRRAGLGRSLLLGALGEWQSISMGMAYAVVAPGSPAEALLRAVEMRPVTSVYRAAGR